MSRKSVWLFVACLLLAGYICFGLIFTHSLSAGATVSRLDVQLTDPDSRFVTIADVIHQSGIDPDTASRIVRDNADLYGLKKRLDASDKLQSSRVAILTDGTLQIIAEPMVPVARVFDTRQPSYYINASGKRISAELRYHLDVPVLVGTFDSVHPAARLLPLLDYISSHPKINALVATVMQEADGNIILVPNIVGHVINFGDTTMVSDKFNRLRQFYRHVAPTRGWERYDTIAVKWRGQVIATLRHKEVKPVALPTEDEQTGLLDIDDEESMASPESIKQAIDNLSSNV